MGAYCIMTCDTVDKIAAMQQERSRLKGDAYKAWFTEQILAIYRVLPNFPADDLLSEHHSWLR
jgi:hypothetical protein